MALSGRDTQEILKFLPGLYIPQTPEELARRLICSLPNLVASDLTSYNEVNLPAGRIFGLAEPEEYVVEEIAPRLEPHLHEHPLIRRYQDGQDGAPEKISDFLSTRRWHRTALYNEFYRAIDVEDQMAVGLTYDRNIIVAVTLNRSNRSFSARDREVLTLLRPHLAQAYQSACSFARLESEIALRGAIVESMASGVLLLRRSGVVEFISDKARRWLDEYFDSRIQNDWRDALRRWLASGERESTSVAPLRVTRGSKILILRRAGCFQDNVLILLDEEIERTPLDAIRALQSLGLTFRQSEVLLLVAEGEINEAIAARLKMSRHTVKRHLEAIYEKLQVSNRNAAAQRARQALSSRENL